MGRLGQFRRGGVAQLDVTLSRTLLTVMPPVVVFDLGNEIDQRVLGAESLGQREFASGNLHHDRHEIFGAIELKIIDLHGNGQVGDRVAEHERVFKLPFLIHGR